eukprot:4467743-Pyramimonas_sp.AAC.1
MTADMHNSPAQGIWTRGPFAPQAHQNVDPGEYYYDASDTSDDDGEMDMVLFGQEDGEPDMSSWSINDRAEFYYQKYKRYRKKWRRFVGKAPRRTRGPVRRRHYLE